MARSDKVPFRREFTISSDGFVGSEDGFFVGDILSLHLDIEDTNSQWDVEGRVGRQGVWKNLASGTARQDDIAIDIRAYEYIRVRVVDVTNTTTITLFGYENNVVITNIIATPDEDSFNIEIEKLCALKDIKEELQKLNTYMELITGDKI